MYISRNYNIWQGWKLYLVKDVNMYILCDVNIYTMKINVKK